MIYSSLRARKNPDRSIPMPFPLLIALFIGIPILELALLLELHAAFGVIPTVLLVFLTGIAGAALVRRQGITTLFEIQRETASGNLPASQIMDGVMILSAGVLLVTPGLITDIAGFALLVPFLRERIRYLLRKKLKEKINRSHIQVHIHDIDHSEDGFR